MVKVSMRETYCRLSLSQAEHRHNQIDPIRGRRQSFFGSQSPLLPKS